MIIKRPNIFISYTTRDKVISREFLREIEPQLEHFGNSYIDILHNDSKNKQERVIKELERSDVIILLETDNSINSPWVQFELKFAEKANKVIRKISVANLDKKPITSAMNEWGFTSQAVLVRSRSFMKKASHKY